MQERGVDGVICVYKCKSIWLFSLDKYLYLFMEDLDFGIKI